MGKKKVRLVDYVSFTANFRIKELVNSETKVSNFHETMLHRILVDEKRLGFETDEEAAYLCLMVIQGAADTVSAWQMEGNN